jgi:hypothetical protein
MGKNRANEGKFADGVVGQFEPAAYLQAYLVGLTALKWFGAPPFFVHTAFAAPLAERLKLHSTRSSARRPVTLARQDATQVYDFALLLDATTTTLDRSSFNVHWTLG